jgi:prevent-host-death family protein
MLDIRRDIHSLTDFKKNTSEFINQLKETGEPVVLTINGRAELVVQDAASYQKLIELAGQAEELEMTRRAVAEMKAGLGRPAVEMLAEMQKVINQKRGQ